MFRIIKNLLCNFDVRIQSSVSTEKHSLVISPFVIGSVNARLCRLSLKMAFIPSLIYC